MNRAEAEALGYTVDEHCYPWFAYKGSRFAPDERVFGILTDKEAELAAALEAMLAQGDFRSPHWAGDKARAALARAKGEQP